MAAKTCLDVSIRWMIRRDMPEILNIENNSFEFPWSEFEFINWLRNRSVIGMVAENCERVVGFMIYELFPQFLNVQNFAVDPLFRRQGIGRQMVDKMVSKLSPQRRRRITLSIRESNLEGQLFFRTMGFSCESIVKNYYADSDDDSYVMVRRLISGQNYSMNCQGK